MIKKFTGLLAILVFTGWAGTASAAVVEVGDLNIINMVGNPSDGLAYLDMTYSDGLSQADALINAQAAYPNARLATPAEADDLFAAAGIAFDGAGIAADAWATGPTFALSTGSNYDAGALSQQLGYTDPSVTRFWTDPDGSLAPEGTLDYIFFTATGVTAVNGFSEPPNPRFGSLIVNPVPVPAAGYLLITALVGMFGMKRFARKQ